MIPDDLAELAFGQLKAAGIENTRKEARLLWDAAKGDREAFLQILARRCNREPMSHILGHRAFFEHDFLVTADVLDPRPETETLVLAALERDFGSVLDLGTGSGCILLSLLAKRTGATGLGVDRSEKALNVARQNSEKLQLTSRVEFLQSDWFGDVTGQFDLIVSNPPYIAADEMPGLAPEVQQFEPRMALTDEADGLDAYRRIMDGAVAHLNGGGCVMVEIGPTQAAEVASLMKKANLENVEVRSDLDGRDRVVIGNKAA